MRSLSKRPKIAFQNQVSLNASQNYSAVLLTFIKLPFVIKIFVLSIFEWPFYTGFTVYVRGQCLSMIIIEVTQGKFQPKGWSILFMFLKHCIARDIMYWLLRQKQPVLYNLVTLTLFIVMDNTIIMIQHVWNCPFCIILVCLSKLL